MHGCRPTGGTRAIKGGDEKEHDGGKGILKRAGGTATGDELGETCRGDGGSDSDGDVHEGDKARGGDRVGRDTGEGNDRGETTRGRGRRGGTHTQVARDNGGELAERVGTRCEQLGVLPRERGEGVCPLEAGHGQVDSVVPREVEGRSAADGCTQSLGV